MPSDFRAASPENNTLTLPLQNVIVNVMVPLHTGPTGEFKVRLKTN